MVRLFFFIGCVFSAFQSDLKIDLTKTPDYESAVRWRPIEGLSGKVSESGVNTFLLVVFAERKSARFNPENFRVYRE